MHKKIIATIILLIITLSSFACAICGCGGSNFYLGLMPHFRTKFIGIRYEYSNYNTVLTNNPTQFSHNYYNSVQVWGGFNVAKRWQLLYIVPVHFNKQIDDDGFTSKNGLGDASIMANYLLFHKTKTYEHNAGIEQQLWVGGGFKLPTGKMDVNLKDPNITVADVNAQLGTGSVDFILTTMYNLRIGNWGINTILTYKANTAKSEYQFGNKFTGSAIGYYNIALKHINLMPNAGMMYENTAANTLSKISVAATGGYVTNAMAGVEVGIKKMNIGITGMAPVSQYYAAGQTKLNWRGDVHVNFSF
ncbi:hypothetical protein [Hydrotalea sp.]|uniref:hypothetical protein n=1 Tax=Hydrotalea sp. TaxID=2881279 RepID=UPI00263627EF|nr:hypothetical protein [Hydrotalea sp.]